MNERPRYPTRFPFVLAAIALAIWALFSFVGKWQKKAPLFQSYYISAYSRVTLNVIPWNKYSMLMYKGQIALPSDPGPFQLKTLTLQPEPLRVWLRGHVYDNKDLFSTLGYPIGGAFLVLLVSCLLANSLDRIINRGPREGRLIRGPRVISKWRWWWMNLTKQKGFYIETK